MKNKPASIIIFCPNIEENKRKPSVQGAFKIPNSLQNLVQKLWYSFYLISRFFEKSRFWGCLKSIKKAHRLSTFKGRACKLDFPALHESNFAAYFTGPEKSVEVDF